MIEYDRLERLKVLKRQLDDIIQEEERLLIPLRKDVNGIRELFLHFNCIVEGLPPANQPDIRARRRMFVFITLYLYSPGALTGWYMDRNVCSVLREVLGLKSKSALNTYTEGLMLWYKNYPDFRELTNWVFELFPEHFKCSAHTS